MILYERKKRQKDESLIGGPTKDLNVEIGIDDPYYGAAVFPLEFFEKQSDAFDFGREFDEAEGFESAFYGEGDSDVLFGGSGTDDLRREQERQAQRREEARDRQEAAREEARQRAADAAAAEKEAARKASEQAFISKFTNRKTPKNAEAVQMPDGTVAFMTKGEQKAALKQGRNIAGGSTGRKAKFLGYRSNRGSRGIGYKGSGYSMGRGGTGAATPP